MELENQIINDFLINGSIISSNIAIVATILYLIQKTIKYYFEFKKMYREDRLEDKKLKNRLKNENDD